MSEPSSERHDPFAAEPLRGRRIALGVTGSVAAIKAPLLASALVQAGAVVDVILTSSARQLVRPLAFQAITHRPVADDMWRPESAPGMDHLAIAHRAERLLIAPVTADTLARLAHGRADDLLTTTALATRAPLLLAPAMEPAMWRHPATRANVALLSERGATWIGPTGGRMASGKEGRGRMVEPLAIVEHLRAHLGCDGPLAGRRVVVSAGPTHEPLDPVRFLGNRSSGTMGIALARAARDAGATVTLVLGPTAQRAPVGVREVPVATAAEMRDAVLDAVLDGPADALVMAAAVADFRPETTSATKIKKGGADGLELRLVRTDDILLEVQAALEQHAADPVRVGFAAESTGLRHAAEAKLRAKGLDIVVANQIPQSFGDATVSAILVSAGGVEELPPLAKPALAGEIMRRVHGLLRTETGESDEPVVGGEADDER